MKRNKLFYILFIFLLGFGFFTRFVKINNFPPSLNWDEVSHGYNAYSILKTGHDEWGKALPIVNFRAYGDYPLPLNLYLTIPSIALLGLNEYSIRLPHMILGFLTIISSYFFAYGLTKNKKISLLTGLLVSIDPWLFFTSRVVFQSNISVFLLTTFGAIFVNRKKSKFLLPMSFIFLYLTLFSYHSTRIFSPILLIGILFLYRKEFVDLIKKKKIEGYASLAVVLIFFISLIFIFLDPGSSARSQWVFVINQGVINRIIELRQASNLPELFTRLIFNRFTFFIKEFVINYIGYFSAKFLFFKGGTQYQFSLQNQGLLYLVNLLFFYSGLVILLFKSIKEKENNWIMVFLWLLISPIPASITSEKYAVLRSSTMLPIPEILISLSFFYIYSYFKNKKIKLIFLFVYIISLLWSFLNYVNLLSNNYPYKYSSSWQYGYKEISKYIKENYSKYGKIIVTKKYGEPHEFLLFFMKWNPNEYLKDTNLIRFYQSGWWWVDKFDKFVFVNDWDIPKQNNMFKLESGEVVNCNKIKCLLISSPDNYPATWKNVGITNFLDGTTAFEYYEN
jgi:4-amino-4-deoxy-L-arabinose transferase-like glycosyltransferase